MFPPPYSLYFTRGRCNICVGNVKIRKKLKNFQLVEKSPNNNKLRKTVGGKLLFSPHTPFSAFEA